MPPNWIANFVIEDKQVKSRRIEEYKDFAFVSKLQLGQYEMPFEDRLIMKYLIIMTKRSNVSYY